MKSDDVIPFESIEPPPGGVERFRQRLADFDDAPRAIPGRRILVAGLSCVLVAVVVATFYRPSGNPDGNTEITAAMADRTGTTATSGDGVPGTAEASDLSSAPAFARLLQRPPSPIETRVAVNDSQVSIDEIPSTNSKIRIYQINNY